MYEMYKSWIALLIKSNLNLTCQKLSFSYNLKNKCQ